jgi:hypothetical protein
MVRGHDVGFEIQNPNWLGSLRIVIGASLLIVSLKSIDFAHQSANNEAMMRSISSIPQISQGRPYDRNEAGEGIWVEIGLEKT